MVITLSIPFPMTQFFNSSKKRVKPIIKIYCRTVISDSIPVIMKFKSIKVHPGEKLIDCVIGWIYCPKCPA